MHRPAGRWAGPGSSARSVGRSPRTAARGNWWSWSALIHGVLGGGTISSPTNETADFRYGGVVWRPLPVPLQARHRRCKVRRTAQTGVAYCYAHLLHMIAGKHVMEVARR